MESIRYDNPICGNNITSGTYRSLFGPYFASVYGGIPAIIAFNFIPTLLCLFFALVVWGFLGALIKGSFLQRYRHTSILNDMNTALTLLRHRISRLQKAHRVADAMAQAQGHQGQRGKEGAGSSVPTFGWDWLRLDRKLVAVYGEDEYQYLQFQRYMMWLLLAISICSVGIILPLNVVFGFIPLFSEYTSGTMINISSANPILFVHTFMGWCYMWLAMLVMRCFVSRVLVKHNYLHQNNPDVLWLTSLPHSMRSKEAITLWASKKYPRQKIRKVYLARNTRSLYKLVNGRNSNVLTFLECRENTKLHAYSCCGCICCCCKGSNARDYYSGKIAEAEVEIGRELAALKTAPHLGMAFVVTTGGRTVDDASRYEQCDIIAEERFRVGLAPPVEDFAWENLGNSTRLKFRYSFVIMVAVALSIFLTTPEAILTQIDDIYNIVFLPEENKKVKVFDLLGVPMELVSVVMLFIAKVVQQMICNAVIWIRYFRQTKTNVRMLRMATPYLIAIILLLPTISFVSFRSIMNQLTQYYNNEDSKDLECIFLAKGGIFFIQYLVSAALFGNFFELIRFSDMVTLIWKISTSRSWKEVSSWLHNSKTKIWFGDYYSYDLVNLAIAVSLSTATPVIAPVGLLYFAIKHLVSTYNLKSAFSGTRINMDFHRVSVTYVVGSTILVQFYTALLTNLRNPEASLSLTSGFLVISSALVYALQISSQWTWPVPVFPQESKTRQAKKTPGSLVYAPKFFLLSK